MKIFKKLKLIKLNKRNILIIIYFICFLIISIRLFYLQIIKGNNYKKKYNLMIKRDKRIHGIRGNIYDCNGNLLAYDKVNYNLIIKNIDKKYNINYYKNLNYNISKLIKILNKNNETITKNIPIIIDNNGKYSYKNISRLQKLRFIADIYNVINIKSLTKKQLNMSAEEIVRYMCSKKKYNVDIRKYSKNIILDILNIRFLITQHYFSQYLDSVISKNISIKTMSSILENIDKFYFVDIKKHLVRTYEIPYAISPIIGYVKDMSQENNKKYKKNKIVGISGIEKLFNKILSGTDGEKEVYVNFNGKVLKEKKVLKENSGKNIKLTIDMNLQEAVYNIIEKKLSVIILSKLTNNLTYDNKSKDNKKKDILIPIGDVYFSFFGNDILTLSDFKNSDKNSYCYNTYKKLKRKKRIVCDEFKPILYSNRCNITKKEELYKYFIVNDYFVNKKILLNSNKYKNSKTYKLFINNKISLNKFLKYCFKYNYINTKLINKDNNYINFKEVLNKMYKRICRSIMKTTYFDKIIYKQMILNNEISGKEICYMAIEQGIFKDSFSDINNVNSYEYLRSKISSLELTSGMMGINPCMASAVVIEKDNGKVRAIVSYPGYDSNRLFNYGDLVYYNKLIKNKSLPLYNKATLELKAPGSVFKMVSAFAGLSTGLISYNSTYRCDGIFDLIKPNPKCLIYPGKHGNINVVNALAESCNCFFYHIGYNLGLNKNHKYNSKKGLNILNKYAKLFCLNEKTGIELQESKPILSYKDSVRSAIGQGSNNFSICQLGAYVLPFANNGTLYKLSILDNITNDENIILKKYKPKIKRKIKTNKGIWNIIRNGMMEVSKKYSYFSILKEKGINIACKTGTTQENIDLPDHASFVGYSITNSKNKEYIVVVRITNGYTSAYATQIGFDIFNYIYK